jgi:hypothetical protein
MLGVVACPPGVLAEDNTTLLRVFLTQTGGIARERDASSAAAGALLLSARARGEIETLLRPPQFR